jgi:ribosomal protein L11 methyltransferase
VVPSSPAERSASAAFARIDVRLPDAEAAERAAAEAYAAGAVGLEEREDGTGVTLLLYARAADAEAVREALARQGAAVAAAEPVPPADWSEAWKAGLEALVVSPRLVVRPSFVPSAASSAAEIVIDPGQAFGTGGHPSTRLALEWIDRIAPGLGPDARILDVGTGTGVLALAALRCAPGDGARAVAFDLDPLAAAAARENARSNGLGPRCHVFAGPIAALRGGDADGFGPYALVVANLLRTEMLPLLEPIAGRMRREAPAVLSGLLASERDAVEAAARAVGLAAVGARCGADASGERWVALLTRR